MNKRVGAMGLGLVALSVGIFVSGQSDNRALAAAQKGAGDKVLKLAAAIKAGNKAEIATLTKALAKMDHDEVMEVLKPRSKGGLGFGRAPGKFTPDGIELKLQVIGRDAPSAAALTKEGEALDEAAYILAALGEVMAVKGPPLDKKGQKKDWAAWSQELKETGENLAKAAKKGGAEVKSAASKINSNCAACHAVFKPN